MVKRVKFWAERAFKTKDLQGGLVFCRKLLWGCEQCPVSAVLRLRLLPLFVRE
jgi:hypothetical protein